MTNEPSSDDRVTIVSGLPRAGTSLLMQLVEAAGLELLVDAKRAPDVDNPNGYFEYAPVKKTLRDASWLTEARGRAVKVVAPLLPSLPLDYRYDVLFIRRDAVEVLASQDAMLRHMGEKLNGIANARMHEILSREERTAVAWAREHARLQCVDHAELIANPTAVCETIAQFLGRPERAAAMVARVDARLHRQRQA